MNLTPHASLLHWSAAYRGLPWQPGAEGPDAYDCWGLARHVEATRFKRDLRTLSIAERNASREQWVAIRDMVQRSQWHQRENTRPVEGDLALMLNALGAPHVGVVIELPELALLHAVGDLLDGEPRGCVRVDRLVTLGALGFGHLQFWRFEA